MMIMEKTFIHCTIAVVSLFILICDENLLSSCPIKINMNKKGFSSNMMDKSRHSGIT